VSGQRNFVRVYVMRGECREDVEFIDALREVLSLSPWRGSERAAREEFIEHHPSCPAITGVEGDGAFRAARVGASSRGSTKGFLR